MSCTLMSIFHFVLFGKIRKKYIFCWLKMKISKEQIFLLFHYTFKKTNNFEFGFGRLLKETRVVLIYLSKPIFP